MTSCVFSPCNQEYYKVTFIQPKRSEGVKSKNGLEHSSFHIEMVAKSKIDDLCSSRYS